MGIPVAPKRDDGPSLILLVQRRGIIPASALDEEILAGFAPGSELQATPYRLTQSKALRAWWALMNAVVKHEDQWVSGRALSNAILHKFGLTDAEQLIGGIRQEPMSLREFSDEQLWRLVEMAKNLIRAEIIPGVDVDELTGRNRGL